MGAHHGSDNLGGIAVADLPASGAVRRSGSSIASFVPTKSSAADPTTGDDSDDGFVVGSLWANSATGALWACTDASVGAAVWTRVADRGIWNGEGKVLTLNGGDLVAAFVGMSPDSEWKRWYVDLTNGDDANAGTEPTIPFLTVQAAVNAMASSATDVNEVIISNGEIVENVTIPAGAKNIIFRGAYTPPGYPGGEQGLFRWGTTWTSTGPTTTALTIGASNHKVLVSAIALFTDNQTPGSATSLATGSIEISIPEPYRRVFKVGKAGSGMFTSDTRQGDVVDIAGMTNPTNNGQFIIIARISSDYSYCMGNGDTVAETGGGGSSVAIRTSTPLISLSAGKLQLQDSYLFAYSANQGGDSQDSRGGEPSSGGGGNPMGLAAKVSSNAKLYLTRVAMKGGNNKGTLLAFNGSGSSLAAVDSDIQHATVVGHLPTGGTSYQDFWIRNCIGRDLHLSNNGGAYPAGGINVALENSTFAIVRADACVDWGGPFHVQRPDLSVLTINDDGVQQRVPVVGGNRLPASPHELASKGWVDSPVLTITNSNHTLTRANRALLFSAGASDRTLSLPAASTMTNESFAVRKTDSGVGKVVIDPNGAELINGASTFTLDSQGDAIMATSDGTGWHIFAMTVGTAGSGSATYADTASTTNATATTVRTLATASDMAYRVKAEVVAKKSDGTAVLSFDAVARFKNDSGTLSQVGSTNVLAYDEDSPGSPTVGISASGTNILVQVTGVAAETWSWSVVTTVQEV